MMVMNIEAVVEMLVRLEYHFLMDNASVSFIMNGIKKMKDVNQLVTHTFIQALIQKINLNAIVENILTGMIIKEDAYQIVKISNTQLVSGSQKLSVNVMKLVNGIVKI